jgi:hypothetical protein
MNLPETARPVMFVHAANRQRLLALYKDTLGLPLRSSDVFGDFIVLEKVDHASLASGPRPTAR